MFVHTLEDTFDSAGQDAFVDYISKGGNLAAVHAADTTYMLKPWMPWTETLGATFLNHPKRQTATFVKEITSHPATNPIPDRWTFGEVYSFTSDPRKLGAKLLFSVDPTSYKEKNGIRPLALLYMRPDALHYTTMEPKVTDIPYPGLHLFNPKQRGWKNFTNHFSTKSHSILCVRTAKIMPQGLPTTPTQNTPSPSFKRYLSSKYF
ncbi:hypothetical protein ACGC1H_006424 [Rhizoctonia solani]